MDLLDGGGADCTLTSVWSHSIPPCVPRTAHHTEVITGKLPGGCYSGPGWTRFLISMGEKHPKSCRLPQPTVLCQWRCCRSILKLNRDLGDIYVFPGTSAACLEITILLPGASGDGKSHTFCVCFRPRATSGWHNLQHHNKGSVFLPHHPWTGL